MFKSCNEILEPVDLAHAAIPPKDEQVPIAIMHLAFGHISSAILSIVFPLIVP